MHMYTHKHAHTHTCVHTPVRTHRHTRACEQDVIRRHRCISGALRGQPGSRGPSLSFRPSPGGPLRLMSLPQLASQLPLSPRHQPLSAPRSPAAAQLGATGIGGRTVCAHLSPSRPRDPTRSGEVTEISGQLFLFSQA